MLALRLFDFQHIVAHWTPHQRGKHPIAKHQGGLRRRRRHRRRVPPPRTGGSGTHLVVARCREVVQSAGKDEVSQNVGGELQPRVGEVHVVVMGRPGDGDVGLGVGAGAGGVDRCCRGDDGCDFIHSSISTTTPTANTTPTDRAAAPTVIAIARRRGDVVVVVSVVVLVVVVVAVFLQDR